MKGRWHSAREICARLKGRWTGHSGTAPCPAHEDRSPSLSLSETRDGRVLVYCHAGCGQDAVIDALRKLGLWNAGNATTDPSYPAYAAQPYDGIRDKSERVRRREAQDIWDAGRSAQGTLVSTYLRARGCRLPLGTELRFSAALYHSEERKSFPAMLARISDEGGFCAVQRTYLDPAGNRKAQLSDSKAASKKTKGPMCGGAVRLFKVEERLGLAEGIETAMSASQLYSIPTWATLSANRLAKIEIPKTVRIITIFSDAGSVGVNSAFEAQDYYERQGLQVDVVTPHADFVDKTTSDFNDVLQGNRAA